MLVKEAFRSIVPKMLVDGDRPQRDERRLGQCRRTVRKSHYLYREPREACQQMMEKLIMAQRQADVAASPRERFPWVRREQCL
jgi:hypothetical protein